MKKPYRKSFIFAMSALLITWAGASNAGQMESGPGMEERSTVGEDASAGPGSWITIEPSVADDIERNNAFLQKQASLIRADLRDLKRLGILEHDSVNGIESTMSQAQTSMTRLLAAKRRGRLATKKAAVIADDLVSQAEALEGYVNDIDEGSGMGPQRSIEKQERVVDALSDFCRVLYNTGRVVRRCIDR